MRFRGDLLAIGVVLVLLVYAIVTRLGVHASDTKSDDETCQIVQGHIDAIHYSQGYYRLALTEQPEVFISTYENLTRYDADTDRMLMSASGTYVTICSLPGSKYPFRDIESGRILPEPTAVP